MTMQAVGLEFQVNLSAKRASEVFFNDDRAEPLLAPGLHPGTEFLLPIDLQRMTGILTVPGPADCDAPVRHRQRAEACRSVPH